ncbi:uncharacterized protein SPSK_11043 [Sporothrix schenckii 1099-18]|nr:uncharacterized protein SPSK_11043 [Sporothrix schenckii 1099-18]KJR89638.1 hypothetical protein SPSK_11043 [Sporothrix schenckii 1099-18]
MESQFHAFYQVSAQSIVDKAASKKGQTGSSSSSGSGSGSGTSSTDTSHTFSEKSSAYTTSSGQTGKK